MSRIIMIGSSIVICAVVWGGSAYVIWHFASKFW